MMVMNFATVFWEDMSGEKLIRGKDVTENEIGADESLVESG